MSASFRDRFVSTVVLLVAMGWFSSAAHSDDGMLDAQTGGGNWIWDGDEPSYVEPSHLFTIRVNALFLHRRAPSSNVVLSDAATGATLLNTSDNEPSWAGGTEVNLLLGFSDTTKFEFDWFSVDDWFDKRTVHFGPTAVDQVPFLVTDAAVSVSSRIRNMEFNLRDEVYNGVTFLAGFRYLEFLDAQRVHYQNLPTGTEQFNVIDVSNRLYGFQIGTQLDFFKSADWELSAFGKVGIYGNSADNNSGIFSSIPGDSANIRAQVGKTAFVGDLGVRGTRRFGEHFAMFVGYRLLYLDGIALAANQIPGNVAFLSTGLPTIKTGDSMLFQGVEGGLSFTF